MKAYFALKLTGHDPSAEYMQRARQAILSHGGADAVNSYTRFYLAMLEQISYDECPAVPPEVMLLPKWFPVNLYAVSAWSRTIIVPLSIISAFRPAAKISPQRGIRELFLRDPENWPPLRCRRPVGRHGVFQLGPVFPRRGWPNEVVPGPSIVTPAQKGDPRGGSLDAEATQAERRPGRDLSAHRLEHRRLEMPGLRRRQPPKCEKITSSWKT